MALFYSGGPAVVIFIVCMIFTIIFCHKRIKGNLNRQEALQLPVIPPAVLQPPRPQEETLPPIRSLEGIIVVQPAGEQAVAWAEEDSSQDLKAKEPKEHKEMPA